MLTVFGIRVQKKSPSRILYCEDIVVEMEMTGADTQSRDRPPVSLWSVECVCLLKMFAVCIFSLHYTVDIILHGDGGWRLGRNKGTDIEVPILLFIVRRRPKSTWFSVGIERLKVRVALDGWRATHL